MVTSTRLFGKKFLTSKGKPVKAFARNIVQAFLCVLCKLYKHLLMNFTKMNCFLLSQVNFSTVTTKSIDENEVRENEGVMTKSSLFSQMQKGSKISSLNKVYSGKTKPEAILSRIGIVGSNWRINDGIKVRHHRLMPSIPVTSKKQVSDCTFYNKSIRKQEIRFPVF